MQSSFRLLMHPENSGCSQWRRGTPRNVSGTQHVATKHTRVPFFPIVVTAVSFIAFSAGLRNGDAEEARQSGVRFSLDDFGQVCSLSKTSSRSTPRLAFRCYVGVIDALCLVFAHPASTWDHLLRSLAILLLADCHSVLCPIPGAACAIASNSVDSAAACCLLFSYDLEQRHVNKSTQLYPIPYSIA